MTTVATCPCCTVAMLLNGGEINVDEKQSRQSRRILIVKTADIHCLKKRTSSIQWYYFQYMTRYCLTLVTSTRSGFWFEQIIHASVASHSLGDRDNVISSCFFLSKGIERMEEGGGGGLKLKSWARKYWKMRRSRGCKMNDNDNGTWEGE